MLDFDDLENDRKFRQKQEFEVIARDTYGKNQIKKTVKTSIETCGIGALSDMENFFGSIWGHGLSYNELTDSQKDFREKWLNCRDSILKRTANSVRLSFREVDRCTIKDYNTRKYNTVIKNKGETNGRR